MQRQLSRRNFLWLISCAAGASTLTTGCTRNKLLDPSQLIFLTKEQDIAIDREHSRHQFSQDMGIIQNQKIHDYVTQIGSTIANVDNPKQLPFSFQVVNANYLHSYAFAGGSIAISRGVLIELYSEDELAALISNEVAHVNLRHWAKNKTKDFLFTTLTLGVPYVIRFITPRSSNTTSNLLLPDFDSQAILPQYTIEQEIESDTLGLQYIDSANYNPQGMVDFLSTMHQAQQTSPAATRIRQTHPISNNRLRAAQRIVQNTYKNALRRKITHEKYMDNIAALRAISQSITAQQQAQIYIEQAQFDQAQALLSQARKQTPEDYSALLLSCRLALVQERYMQAQMFANQAQAIYPQEAQAYNLHAVASIGTGNPQKAIELLNTYNTLLPGNPHITFLLAYSYDLLKENKKAIEEYKKYVQIVHKGQQANYARKRIEDIDT